MKKILFIIFLCFVFKGFSNFSLLNDKDVETDSSDINNKINHSVGFELFGSLLVYSIFYDLTYHLKNNNFIGFAYSTKIMGRGLGLGEWGNSLRIYYGFGNKKSSRISFGYGNIANFQAIQGKTDWMSPWDQPSKFYHIFSLYSGQYFKLGKNKNNFSFFFNMGGNVLVYNSKFSNGEPKRIVEVLPFGSLGIQYKIK